MSLKQDNSLLIKSELNKHKVTLTEETAKQIWLILDLVAIESKRIALKSIIQILILQSAHWELIDSRENFIKELNAMREDRWPNIDIQKRQRLKIRLFWGKTIKEIWEVLGISDWIIQNYFSRWWHPWPTQKMNDKLYNALKEHIEKTYKN